MIAEMELVIYPQLEWFEMGVLCIIFELLSFTNFFLGLQYIKTPKG